MINLADGELRDILPGEFIRQPQVVAISYALKQEYARFFLISQTALVYAAIDQAGDTVLDYLAVELHVRYYSRDFDIDKKRALIKTAIQVGAKDGTKYAVDTAIQTAVGNGKSLNWFEYGGDPGHYRIDINMEGYDLDDLFTAINTVKRLSAHLDGINLQTDMDQEIYFGSIMQGAFVMQTGCVEPDFPYTGPLILDRNILEVNTLG